MTMQYGQLADRGTVKALQTRFSLSPDFTLNLSPELAAVIPLEMPELFFQQGFRRWQKATAIAALAANRGQSQFRQRDPTAAIPGTQLIVLERIIVACNAATQVGLTFSYGPATADLATAVGGTLSARDGRMTPANADPNVVMTTGTTAGAYAPQALDVPLLASTPFEVPGGPWILFPGNSVLVEASVVNQAFFATYVWRERIIQEQEQTP